ncbi:MAG: FkbM family methyltransferase [Polyangiales bacterium]
MLPPGLKKLRHAANVLAGLRAHPAARAGGAPMRQFLAWQLRKHVLRAPVIAPVFDGSARMRFYPDSHITNAVRYFGWPDWHEMHFLARYLNAGDVFVDVGANVGVYSVLAATKVGAKGEVWAIEPDPASAERLAENFELNALDPKRILRVIAGATAGQARFDVGRDVVGSVVPEGRDGGESLEVRPLDACFPSPRHIDAIKIDVKGFELEVLKGAAALLVERRIGVLLLEMISFGPKYGSTRDAVERTLRDAGYALFAASSEGLTLNAVPPGGPYPENAFAIADVDAVRRRIPGLTLA